MSKQVKIFVEDITPRWGTERAVINLANNLEHHGYQVTVISLYSSSGYPSFTLASGVTIKHCDVYKNQQHDSIAKRINRIINLTKTLLKNISKKDDIIIGTEVIINSLLGMLKLTRRSLKNKKILGWDHMVYDFPNPMARKLRHLFYKRLDKIILLTKQDEKRYKKDKYINTFVIPNEAPQVKDVNQLTRHQRLLAIGRLTEMKGFDILINDISPLLNEFPEWILEIYGDGEMKKELLDLIDKNGMNGRIKIQTPREDIFTVYQEASIYLMSSRFESFGIVLIEAQANGLPIVAYASEGPNEIIDDGRDGYLVPIGRSEEFRQAIKKLIIDRNLREQMGLQAIESAKALGYKENFVKWEKILESKI